MTVREEMEMRIKEYRATGSVADRMLAIITENTMEAMTEETLNRELTEASE